MGVAMDGAELIFNRHECIHFAHAQPLLLVTAPLCVAGRPSQTPKHLYSTNAY